MDFLANPIFLGSLIASLVHASNTVIGETLVLYSAAIVSVLIFSC